MTLDKNINFIIGRNGNCKTKLIKLVKSVILCENISNPFKDSYIKLYYTCDSNISQLIYDLVGTSIEHIYLKTDIFSTFNKTNEIIIKQKHSRRIYCFVNNNKIYLNDYIRELYQKYQGYCFNSTGSRLNNNKLNPDSIIRALFSVNYLGEYTGMDMYIIFKEMLIEYNETKNSNVDDFLDNNENIRNICVYIDLIHKLDFYKEKEVKCLYRKLKKKFEFITGKKLKYSEKKKILIDDGEPSDGEYKIIKYLTLNDDANMLLLMDEPTETLSP